jgi:hypothetical protein
MRHIKHWAHCHGERSPVIRKDDGTMATDDNISGGDQVKLVSGPRALADTKR